MIKSDMIENEITETCNDKKDGLSKIPQNDFKAMVQLILLAVDIKDRELLTALPCDDIERAINCLVEFSDIWEASKFTSIEATLK